MQDAEAWDGSKKPEAGSQGLFVIEEQTLNEEAEKRDEDRNDQQQN